VSRDAIVGERVFAGCGELYFDSFAELFEAIAGVILDHIQTLGTFRGHKLLTRSEKLSGLNVEFVGRRKINLANGNSRNARECD
jgi:hypothetical protein